MIGDLNVVLVSLTVSGAFGVVWLSFGVGGVGFCCGTGATLGFDALLKTALGFAALLFGGKLVSGIFCTVVTGVLTSGTLGCCTAVCLFRNNVIVGCCCFVCGACSNAFHMGHKCSHMLCLFARVGGFWFICWMVLLKS